MPITPLTPELQKKINSQGAQMISLNKKVKSSEKPQSKDEAIQSVMQELGITREEAEEFFQNLKTHILD